MKAETIRWGVFRVCDIHLNGRKRIHTTSYVNSDDVAITARMSRPSVVGPQGVHMVDVARRFQSQPGSSVVHMCWIGVSLYRAHVKNQPSWIIAKVVSLSLPSNCFNSGRLGRAPKDAKLSADIHLASHSHKPNKNHV